MKIIKKIVLYSFIFSAVILISATVSIYLYQDRLVNLVIRELNKSINTPIETEQVEISIWQEFPKLTLSFHNTEIKESIRNNRYPLARMEKIHLAFNPWKLIQGNYTLDQLYLNEGEVTIRITAEGKVNYNIINKKANSSDSINFSLDLQKINLKNVLVNYVDEGRKQTYRVYINKGLAQLNYQNGEYLIPLESDVVVDRIQLGEHQFFQEKELNVKGEIIYNELYDLVSFKPSELVFEKGKYFLSGQYNLKESRINVKIEGKDTQFEQIIVFLSDEYASALKPYQSKGDLYFRMSIAGYITTSQNPQIDISFGTSNSSFYHPDYQFQLENTSFEGRFSNGAEQSLRTSYIELNKISTTLDQQSIKGSIKVKDFIDFKVMANLSGNALLARLYSFTGNDWLYDISGNVLFDFNMNGRLADFDDAKTINQLATSGNASVTQVSFKVKDFGLPFEQFSGNFLFNKSDLAISRLDGYIGNSEIHLQGMFNNAISYLLFENQSLSMEADLQSSFIDMDELLSGTLQDKGGDADNELEYRFSIPENLDVQFNSQIELLKFRRFRGREIHGAVNIHDQMLTANNIQLKTGDGEIVLNGIVDAKKTDRIEVSSSTKLNHIALDSAFYIFEDFDQDWLTHKNLKGSLYAEAETFIIFDNTLNYLSESIKASISASIKNGQLNDFEPMQELARFVDEDELARLRFSELKNDIIVENRVITLPEMEISSNVSNILVNGRHTFDQEIDYRLVVPLKTLRKKDKDEAFGAIEEDGRGGGNLYVSVIGTTDDYKISWDAKRTVKQLAGGLKREKEALKNAIKKDQQKKKKEVKLSDDDFFDF